MFSRILTIPAAAFLAASLLLPSGYAAAPNPSDGVRSAIRDLYGFLDTSGDGPNWRLYLRDAQLQAQLARGDAANPDEVLKLLSRYGTGVGELQSDAAVKVRRAMVDWLAAMPAPQADQLPSAARAAKAAFLPPTKADLDLAKADLMAALGRLDARLKIGGERGQGWADYLKLDALKGQLARSEAPDGAVLTDAYGRLASRHDGLKLVWFADVRQGLRHYIATARFMGRADLRKQYETALEDLAGNIEKYRKDPSAQTALAIGDGMTWLEQAGQAKWLIGAVRRQLSHPNVFVEVSAQLVSARLAMPVDETTPVQDYILGTDIRGTGHAVGQLSAEMLPSEEAGRLDLVFHGRIDSDTTGYNGPVQILSTGTTQMEARKQLSLTAERIAGSAAVSQADTSTTIDAICSNRGSALIERLAWRRATKQKAQAECIASRHAEQRFNERMDQQADELIAGANDKLVKRFRRPMAERQLMPEVFRLRTTPSALHVTLLQAAGGSLAAPGAPPDVPSPGDLAVRLHQSAVNNVAHAALGGVVLDEKRLYELLEEYIGPVEPGERQPQDTEEWSITFAARQPISVGFDEGKLAVTIRGQEYYADGETHPAMNVTAVYRIEKTGRGWKAVRQGKLSIFPPGFDPNSGEQLAGRIQVLRTILERRFGKFLKEELTPKNLVFAPEGRQPVSLQLTRWDSTRGWLVMAWKDVSE